MTDFLIRFETAGDLEGVGELLLEAFPTSLELRLVQQLHEDGDIVYSLVAVEAARVIGHVLFSRLAAPTGSLALAPVAVAADRRRRGVAAALIEAGLEMARKEGWAAVVVLGDPCLLPALRIQPGTPCEASHASMRGLL